jgi:predicted nucleic acid-binding protein
MLCVLDSSIIGSLFLPDEASARSAKLTRRIGEEGATAPGIWQLETANLFIMAERRKRITPAQRRLLAEAVDSLPVVLQSNLSHKQRDAVIEVAQLHHLTVYDAAYLELALRQNLPLATLDKALRSAAKSAGTALLP